MEKFTPLITGSLAQLTVNQPITDTGGYTVTFMPFCFRQRCAGSVREYTAHTTSSTLIGNGIFLCCQSYICKCGSNVPTGHEEQWESSTH